MATKYVIVRVTREEHRSLKRAARSRKTTMTSLIRAWIKTLGKR